MATPPAEPQPYSATPQAESHLWDYVHVLLRRRRVVIAVFTAVFALATLRTLLTRPVYEGTAQILIERNDPSVLNFKEVAQLDSQRDDYYQTQYKLLQSRSLARRRVVDQLDLLQRPRVRRTAATRPRSTPSSRSPRARAARWSRRSTPFCAGSASAPSATAES